MANKRYYQYIITLTEPMWPRKLADELSFAPTLAQTAVSVTDLQNDRHSYGHTYAMRQEESDVPTPASARLPQRACDRRRLPRQ